MTKHLTGCRHVQKSHDVVLHIPPSSSANTSVKLLMIELTEHHLMIHILLAPIRRSTDPQAYVHNPNISQIYSSLTTVYSSFSMGAIQICRRSSVPEGFMVKNQRIVWVQFPTQQASKTSKALISASRRQAGTTMRRLMPNLSVGYPLPSTEQRINTISICFIGVRNIVLSTS